MKISPLVRHAAMRVPAMTDYFSERLDTLSLDVKPSGFKCLLTLQSPHGLTVGDTMGICITEMLVPNKILSVTQATGGLDLETEHGHDFYQDDDRNLILSGFADPNYNVSFVDFDVINAKHLLLPASFDLPVLTGTEHVKEALEGELTGWHKVTALSETTLEFNSPSGIVRSYTIDQPKVVHNIRVFGELSFDDARAAWVQGMGDPEHDQSFIEASALFICPPRQVRMSVSRQTRTDGLAEIQPGTDFRETMLDGVDVYVFCPKNQALTNVDIADLVQSTLIRVMNKTFFGLKLDRSEFYAHQDEHSVLVPDNHQAVFSNNAYYMHVYRFEAPAVVRNEDVIQAHEYPDFSQQGDSLRSYGARTLQDISFDALSVSTQGLKPSIS